MLLVDLQSDADLKARLDEARSLLLAAPETARASMLSLLVSSWLGGHLWKGPSRREAIERAAAEDRAWRAQHCTNVRPLGSLRTGDSRARALLFKLAYDEVLAARLPTPRHGPPARRRCAADGRYQCTGHVCALIRLSVDWYVENQLYSSFHHTLSFSFYSLVDPTLQCPDPPPFCTRHPRPSSPDPVRHTHDTAVPESRQTQH